MSKPQNSGAALTWIIFVPGVISVLFGSIAGAIFFGLMFIAVAIDEIKGNKP